MDNTTNISVAVRVLIRKEDDKFVARSADYEIVSQGETEKEAAEMLVSSFIATYLRYSEKGLSFEECHPKAAPQFSKIFDQRKLFTTVRTRKVENRRFSAKMRPMYDREMCMV